MFKLFSKSRTKGATPFPDVSPDEPFTAFGDIHGRADLLEKVLSSDWKGRLVFVGDYIDRGPDSAAVLALLSARTDIVAMAGNHEQMIVRFLEEPIRYGANWLRNGGNATLESFGVTVPEDLADPAVLRRAAMALSSAMGTELVRWLQTRPLSWRSGNVAVVHAGADPALPMEDQSARVLLWGHPDFHKVRREDGTWVVHGHTIVSDPRNHDGRISIDTGAYATGRLTGATVSEGTIVFSSVTS